MAFSSSQTSAFSRAFSDVLASLSPEERSQFKVSTLNDLTASISNIEKEYTSVKSVRALTRLQPFLNAMGQYGKMLEMFAQGPDYIGAVWVMTL